MRIKIETNGTKQVIYYYLECVTDEEFNVLIRGLHELQDKRGNDLFHELNRMRLLI